VWIKDSDVMINRLTVLSIAVVLLMSLSVSAQSSQTFTAGGVTYTVEKLTDANYPVALAYAPDGRLFYTEKISGNVRVISADGVLQAEPVITLAVDSLVERGLLGIAIDPAYDDNGYIWVFRTAPGTPRDYPANQVVRFTEADGVGRDPEILLSVPLVGGTLIHNGGNLHFDRRGRLYVSIGNYETPAFSQDLDVMPGKIHRFDVTEDGLVPAEGNPFEGSSIYAYGLRNPFDFDFMPADDRVLLYASENGDSCDDEINLILPGKNYGAGPNYTCGGTAAGIDMATYQRPLLSFTPTEAPTAVLVYPNPDVAAWFGKLMFCVWNNGNPSLRLVTLNESLTQVEDVEELLLGEADCRIDLAAAPDGTLAFTSVGADGGQIWTLTPR
jgi:glucose/arabinose dehydrogenase